jgi:hypothetical protein
MVKLIIGEHNLSVNDYILHTCVFLTERKLIQDYQAYLIEASKAGKNDG